MSLQDVVRAVVDAYGDGNPAGENAPANERREHWFAVRTLLEHDAAGSSCDCAGCWATRNHNCAQLSAAEGDLAAAQWHQCVGDAWYLAHLFGRSNGGADPEAECQRLHVVCANTLKSPAGPPAMEDRRRRVARPGQAPINKEVVERPRPDSASGVTAEVMAPQPCSCRRRNAAGGDLPSSARTGA